MKKFKQKYQEEAIPLLIEKFKYKNPILIPHLVKIVVSMGIGETLKDKNILQDALKELTLITAQKPLVTRARKSIAEFKLREGSPIGLKVTLRKQRMCDFYDRLVHVVAPRIRDFRGFKDTFDGQGNYSIGIEDHQIFPELNLDEVKRTQGMNITFVTTAKTDEECRELLTSLGFPFKKNMAA